METERRFATLDSKGDYSARQLSGVVIRYGDIATIGARYRERFVAGAFGEVAKADVVLNAQHDRRTPIARTNAGLVFADDSTSLRMTAELAETRAADDVLALVKAKILRGLSVEFRAKKDRNENGVRVIEEAELVGLGVVDSPAYGESKVAARWLEEPKPVPRTYL